MLDATTTTDPNAGAGFDFSSLIPLLGMIGGLAGGGTSGGFFGRPEAGQVPNLEPPGWQNLRSMLFGNVAQNYFGQGYSSAPNTGVLGFPSFDPAGGRGTAANPTTALGPGAPGVGRGAMPMPGGAGGGGGGPMRSARPPAYAGRRLRRIPGRPRPPWQMQSTVPQTQPGITPAYAGELPEPIAPSPFQAGAPSGGSAVQPPQGPTSGGLPARMPGRTFAGSTFQPSPSGTPQFGRQPKGRTAIGAPDYGMGHNLLRMLSMLKQPPATRTVMG